MIRYPQGIRDNNCAPHWHGMDDRERALAYSPSSMLDGDPAPFIQSYTDKSAAAYRRLSPVTVLRYGPLDANTIDMVTPDRSDGAASTPLLVFIHGGYWCDLSKTDSFFAAPASLDRKWAFAAIDYTLAPRASLDEIVDECCLAIECLHQHATSLGFDRNRIIVSGSSAGAHLAAMSCLRLRSEYLPAAAVLLSGIFNLEPLIGTYINEPLDLDFVSARRNSPAHQNLTGFPPTLIAWGAQETDEFKCQSLAFAQMLESAKTDVEAIQIEDRNHFDIAEDIASDSALGLQTAALVRATGAIKNA